ncbi:hypothetical protein KJ855_03325, partial [Patescibacteria group bacterium]|nr:hypothetical protein [Patescibacteria group bacterium]
MPKPRNLFVLIDANALIHRAYHAIPHLTTKDGTPVNACYGFTMTLLSALKELNPTYIAAAFDLPQPTFRHKEFKNYKAQRKKADDELIAQIPLTKKILQALNIPIYEQAGLEADDIIGITTQSIKQQKIPVIIVTGDMDALQLVNDNTKVFTLRRGLKDTIIYNPKTVKQRYGFPPKHLIDYKALRGDPSDNIPGVPGIGEKTATTLIKKFKTIEELYSFLEKNPDTDRVKPRVKNLLTEYKDAAFLSKKLVTIITDQPLKDFKIPDCIVSEYDQQKAVDLFQKLEFKSLIPRLPKSHQPIKETLFDSNVRAGSPRPSAIKGKKYITISTIDELKNLIPKLKNGFTFDTETSALDLYDHTTLVGISISIKPNEAYYLPLKHRTGDPCGRPRAGARPAPTTGNLPFAKTIALLKPIFADHKIPKTGHNLKFDIQAMALAGIQVNGIEFDTMLASYLIQPSSTSSHKLDHLAFNYLGHHMIPITALIGEGKDQISFEQVPIEPASIYSCEDADITLILKEKLNTELKENKLHEIFEKIEMPLVPILTHMEQSGIILDQKYLVKFNQKITTKINQLTKKIHQSAGQDFNIASTQQLAGILFDQLNLDRAKVKKTKTGLSTAAAELEKLKLDHPIISLIQQFRLLTKLK